MRKVVIDMQNYLFSDAIAKVLKSYDSDFFIEMSDTPDKTAELCRVIQPHDDGNYRSSIVAIKRTSGNLPGSA